MYEVSRRVGDERGASMTKSPSDMVEYHVVRRGVNQDDVRRTLSLLFRNVRPIRYWSTPVLDMAARRRETWRGEYLRHRGHRSLRLALPLHRRQL